MNPQAADFAVGDVVTLRGGGPSLTITALVRGLADNVTGILCVYFTNLGELRETRLPVSAVQSSGSKRRARRESDQ